MLFASVTSTILDYHVVLRDRTGSHRPEGNQVEIPSPDSCQQILPWGVSGKEGDVEAECSPFPSQRPSQSQAERRESGKERTKV